MTSKVQRLCRVCGKSRVVLDSCFGDIEGMTEGKGLIKTTKRQAQRPPFKPASRESSFATAVATMSGRTEQDENKQSKPNVNQGELKKKILHILLTSPAVL